MDCPPGTYLRTGFRRRSFTRADGVKVRATQVNESCVSYPKRRSSSPTKKSPVRKSKGKTSPTRKSPKKQRPQDQSRISRGGKVSLKAFGYSSSNSNASRHNSLKDAVEYLNADEVDKIFGYKRVFDTLKSAKRLQSNRGNTNAADVLDSDMKFINTIRKSH